MELFDQIRKISFAFFLAIGLIHFVSGLFFVNGYLIEISGLVNRVLFIPFVLSAMTYAFSNFKYHMLSFGKDSKGWTYAFIICGAVIFCSLLAIELLFKDSPSPLLIGNL